MTDGRDRFIGSHEGADFDLEALYEYVLTRDDWLDLFTAWCGEERKSYKDDAALERFVYEHEDELLGELRENAAASCDEFHEK